MRTGFAKKITEDGRNSYKTSFSLCIVSQFKIKNDRSENKRKDVCENDGKILFEATVDKPKNHARNEYDIHISGNVLRASAHNDTNELRQKRDRRE